MNRNNFDEWKTHMGDLIYAASYAGAVGRLQYHVAERDELVRLAKCEAKEACDAWMDSVAP